MIPPQRAVEVVQTIDRQNKMHSNSEHPLVRKIKDNLFIFGINFLFVNSLAMDQSVKEIGQHSVRLLDDEQAPR